MRRAELVVSEETAAETNWFSSTRPVLARGYPDNKNNHQSEETADDLPQRAIEELAELELHRVIQHKNVDGARQRPQRSETPFLHFDPDKERHRRR